MSVNCPVCNGEMIEVPIGFVPSGFRLEKYRCEPCKVTARVETTYSCDEESPSTSTASQEKP